ncbi:hypothetical protein PILCRDRAFT_88172 [Piloderma croceum F 1598]|uniref:Uncharacterized protein n=1 Tax=Piloderma croceum (strain F 1598) TaxID=765440 RepID=A0A0C3FYL0_PILCF|nr:hypothetical protein PILCRDRAFT_88172 [Piloderma croceum F 1598]
MSKPKLKSKPKEQTFDEEIRNEIIPSLPADIQQKWFFRPVDPTKPKITKRKKKKKSNDDGNSDIEVGEPSAKKLKLPVPDSEDEDAEDDGSIQISTYIYVSSVAPQIIISMPLPTPNVRDVPWVADEHGEDDGNDGQPIEYNHTAEDLLQALSGMSIRDQMQGIDAAAAPYINQLLECYVIRHSALFPTKRIYSDGDRHWELTDMWLRIWAVALVQNKATLESPPVSTHFSEAHRIQPPAVAHPLPILGAQVAPTPIATPIAPGSHDLLLQLAITNPMLAQLILQQQQQQLIPAMPAPLHPNPAVPAPISAPSSPAVVLRLPRPITLHEFCEHYRISTIDEAKLEKLKYMPGDKNVEKLKCEDWQGFAGFAKLGWDKIVGHHRQFVHDVIGGLWDVVAAT